jgi:UDP-N-acetylglucosamine 2-epimerase (non-hydrolysing)
MKKISVVFGTRPEAIKLAPVIRALVDSEKYLVSVCVTGQHKEMLYQVLSVFNIQPDYDLELMQVNQSLASFTARAISAIDDYLSDECPDLILVQGDTTTVFCTALVAFYHKIQLGHVEAGLRTWNMYSPFPEEINRVLTTKLSWLHFAPTEGAKLNLLQEGIKTENIVVTGNTVIDSLLYTIHKVRDNPELLTQFVPELIKIPASDRVVLITGHRRESFGKGLNSVCEAILYLSNKYPTVWFIYPVHLNPNVKEPVHKMLGKQSNIMLIDPLEYSPFIALMLRAYIIITDSGGIQEEAPTLNTPVLITRDSTERPEAVECGAATLVGTKKELIVAEFEKLISNPEEYQKMATARNPYGDGTASESIYKSIDRRLCT